MRRQHALLKGDVSDVVTLCFVEFTRTAYAGAVREELWISIVTTSLRHWPVGAVAP